MYPDFQYLFQSIFGTAMPEWLSLFKTFGFFVALSFLGAAWTTMLELKRKEKQGLLLPEFKTIEVGRPASTNELLLSALAGFIIGYKLGGVFGNFQDVSPNPMGYLFSAKGSIIGGIIGALIIAYGKYAEKRKEQLPEPKIKKVAVYPHQLISEIVVIAAVGGLIGAKVFNAFETWDDFIKDPAGNLLSSSGLTFYGGLIVATACFYFYARTHKIPFKYLCDAAAPGLMLAYGVGRLGCHFSGDGDWGIYNTAYVSEPNGDLRLSQPADYHHALSNIGSYQHAYAAAPNWLPRWLFGMNYPHNVNNDGMSIADCAGNYCHVLPVSVFPTPIYEATVCILFFFILWCLRRHFKYPLHMFGAYLILNGVERFFVELIRVNYKYDLGFIHPTQAEIISVVLVLAGAGLLLFYKGKNKTTADPSYKPE